MAIARRIADARYREELIGLIDGANTTFTSSMNFDRTRLGHEEWVLYNGQWMREGVGNDYVASESGGVGTGYDTIVTIFVPRPGDVLEIIYVPS